MRELFHDELKKLRGRFMEMGINVSEQIYQSTKAFSDHDIELANKVIKSDDSINEEEMSLEQQALNLIALQQPLASDFRIIISMLKASNDLERIGDNAINISKETIRAKGNPRIKSVEETIDKMTKHVRRMLEQVLDAYVKVDVKVSMEVAQEDLKLDEYYAKTRDEITRDLKEDSNVAQAAASYLMVIRLLERIGDHTVNLAEWIVYTDSGKFVELNLKNDENSNHHLNDK
ncbi:phosphate signaling complex protein PhoU [Lactobacillus sp. S2-2]|uniref:phosphate signaling complex protein PhoU n=1 Tax=Lactobacillus sp. S2-2 TaxID=2692917 RepID=UPI001EFFBF55|nr:phosphate signaling complex protein PhoU [Lactobacillus sp. S2-2]MCF6515315.1 phosphate signaling complex protein PhoU [Lactobacillus sp. S2-2]